MVNRVGDFGFVLGIALVLAYFGGSLRYADVFAYLPQVQNATIELVPGVQWSLITVTCLLLFVGAMGKSAQFPLHVWLPDSNGRPDTDFRADSRGNDGYCRPVYGVAHVADLRIEQHCVKRNHGHRRDYRAVYGPFSARFKTTSNAWWPIPPYRSSVI